ncbi:hypothetical protein NIES267_42220 [Calothrix parasitica NIES-267]|uniref:Uncharacterized protein n=1 Tax=Calothrix parasitica NIES-267 TaxID=1973488 RepID=A0A1Z4LU01_9CYAN|nr:hypothetical protein NIES267_42220 [Calothrix parasitica NIES-267]
MVRQMDFRWRYQPRKTVDVQLMKYIQSNLMMGKTQMMLLAVRSFWLTHAVADYSDDKKEVQRIARNCIQALRKQTQEIIELAGLEDVSTPFVMQNSRELNYQSATNNSENNLYDDAGLSNFM